MLIYIQNNNSNKQYKHVNESVSKHFLSLFFMLLGFALNTFVLLFCLFIGMFTLCFMFFVVLKMKA